jgi:hypothetical protein
LVCAFWASQVFLVPILPFGPWPIWPALSDLIILLMIPAVLVSPRIGDKNIVWLQRLSPWLLTGCLLSLVIATAVYGVNRGTFIGVQQVYRAVQILFVLLATSKVRLTLERIEQLRKMSVAVFAANCLAVLATAFGLPSGISTPLLPDSPLVSGPWAAFIDSVLGEGTGFISYNHAYTAVQLILCAGLALAIGRISDRWRVWFHILFLVAMFSTRSRIGFICALAFILIYELKRSRKVVLGMASVAIACSLFMAGSAVFADYAERQLSSTSSLNEDQFSNRVPIWQEHIQYLADHPFAALFGVGFGYSYETVGENAHMLYLHVATELGLVGLGVFLWVSWKILNALKVSRSMYWCFIVFLLTGLSQETFYPTIAFTHFLAFFLSAAVAVIRIKRMRSVTLTQLAAFQKI